MDPSLIYVTLTDPDQPVGGWGAIGHCLLKGLEGRYGGVDRLVMTDVPVGRVIWAVDKGMKVLGLPRPMAAFSEGRLAEYARRVSEAERARPGVPLFFVGGASYGRCRPKAAYFAYLDGHFPVFVSDYIPDAGISRRAVRRVAGAEGEFLRGAAGVFVTSRWIGDRICADYGVGASRVHVVGIGPGVGGIRPDGEPTYEPFLLFVATDVRRKRADVAVGAVRAARERGTKLGLTIIGQRPAEEHLRHEFVRYLGWLNPREPSERATMVRLFQTCLAHVLPSRADMTPISIVESAIFKKATVATAVGGIPEMIRDGETGLLIGAGESMESIGARLAELAATPGRAEAMGRAAHEAYRTYWNWESIVERIGGVVDRYVRRVGEGAARPSDELRQG